MKRHHVCAIMASILEAAMIAHDLNYTYGELADRSIELYDEVGAALRARDAVVRGNAESKEGPF